MASSVFRACVCCETEWRRIEGHVSGNMFGRVTLGDMVTFCVCGMIVVWRCVFGAVGKGGFGSGLDLDSDSMEF